MFVAFAKHLKPFCDAFEYNGKSIVTLPLITSLPPSMRRPLADGGDVGTEYQAMCAASWRAAGFTQIISVNAKSELAAKPEIYKLAESLGIAVVGVDRDATDWVTRPYVYVSDLVGVGCDAAGSGNVAIINADILLSKDATAADLASYAKPGQFAIARRVAADLPGGPTREPWYWGFDFFVGDVEDFRSAPDIDLVFGCAWWDHLFPALLYLSGKKMVHIEGPFAAHLEHEERASDAIRAKLGYHMLEKMERFVSQKAVKSELTARYAAALQQVIHNRSGRPLRDLAVSVRKYIPWCADMEELYLMHRFAAHNVKFIDEFRAPQQQMLRT
jgi:hypothetical protein